jgi:hypothetical protein
MKGALPMTSPQAHCDIRPFATSVHRLVISFDKKVKFFGIQANLVGTS